MSEDQRFRRSERLRLQQDFARVLAEKCSQADDALIVYVARNDLAWSRLGRSVGRRIGNAVRRNYVRRRIREAFRTQKDVLPTGLDIVCIASRRAADPDWDIGASLRRLVEKAVGRLSSRGYSGRADASGTQPDRKG